MSDRILTMNERDTLSTSVAIVDLQRILLRSQPTLGGLQEWNAVRDKATRNLLNKLGYGYTRGPHGGGPILWDTRHYTWRRVRSERLALPEFVGHLPGRRSRLGSSWATEAFFTDLSDDSVTVVMSAHLTAEVEDATRGGYKRDPRHWLRVMRHKREKRRLGRRARWHRRKGRTVFVLGDTNFDNMPLGGFTSCWDHRSGGSLGWRAVDIVYASESAREVRTFSTNSDHDAVLAVYP